MFKWVPCCQIRRAEFGDFDRSLEKQRWAVTTPRKDVVGQSSPRSIETNLAELLSQQLEQRNRLKSNRKSLNSSTYAIMPKSFLEYAKRAVEIAIEQDEQNRYRLVRTCFTAHLLNF